jgi:hypothetical protein
MINAPVTQGGVRGTAIDHESPVLSVGKAGKVRAQ